MAGQPRKRRAAGRISIVLGLGIAALAFLWFAFDLAQIALPAPDLPEWAQPKPPQRAGPAAGGFPSFPSSTAPATPTDGGRVPAVLPADPTGFPASAAENTQTLVTPAPTSTVAPPKTEEPTPSPTPTPLPTEVPKIPTRIVIPSIDLDAPIVPVDPEMIEIDGAEYQQWNAPDEFAAGWHTTSARLGEGSNTVLNGHHNIDGEVFGHLVDLEEGATIEVYGGAKKYLYQVTQRMILPERDQPLEVRLENASWIAPTDDERLTLITCWPANSNTHRLIIVASPVDP